MLHVILCDNLFTKVWTSDGIVFKYGSKPIQSGFNETCRNGVWWYNKSYFIKLLVEKKYALPYRVIDAMVTHFMRFCEDSRDMPVIWHQSLLAFMKTYKHELTKEQKDDINYLVKK
ncbi:putative bystin [Helianthus annuus]|nr:putative bystin [Helianthus annuus]